MKHYAHTLIYLVCLVSVWLLCGCRTTNQSNSSIKEHSNLSISDTSLHIRTEDARTRFDLNQEQEGKKWKVKVNFDTTQPADPSTGLPPVSGIEIEGSENTTKTILQKNDSTHVTDKQETKHDISLQQNSQSDSHRSNNNSIAGGIDSGLKYGLIIGIPVVLIILILITYARYQEKNPSK